MTGEKTTILIADDEPTIRQYLRELLEEAGYGVLEACDGQEAVEVTRASGASLVIMDIDMPGLDGYTALRLIKAQPLQRRIPVIVLTGEHRGEEFSEYSKELGALYHLAKPVKSDRLLEAVESALEDTHS